MPDNLHIGDAIRLENRCTLVATNTPTDPTTLMLEVKDPSGNVGVYTYAAAEITRESVGVFYKDITFDEAGWWVYEWHATGAVIAVEGNKILVKAQLI
jgi:hypothetical protein